MCVLKYVSLCFAQTKMIKLLLSLGADKHAENDEGKFCFQLIGVRAETERELNHWCAVLLHMIIFLMTDIFL